MDQELAKYLLAHFIRSSTNLASVLPTLKIHLAKDDYEAMASGISKAMATISTELTNKILLDFPEMKEKIDSEIEKYGIVL